MGTLHYGKVVATVFSATTAQAGYPATNIGNESLGRPWRATGVGANDVTMEFPVVKTVKTLEVHDVNFAQAAILKSSDGVVFAPIAGSPLVTYMGTEGRRRGAITVNDANVKALRISIGAGAATDGLAYWRIGSAPAFASSVAIAAPHQFGYRCRFIYPQLRSPMADGSADSVAYSGRPGFHIIEVPFLPEDDESLEEAVRRARAGTVLLDAGMSNYPWQIWPARIDERELAEAFSVPKASELTLTFREVV